MATLEQELLADFADGFSDEEPNQNAPEDALVQLQKDFGGSPADNEEGDDEDGDDMDIDEESKLAAEHEKKHRRAGDMQSVQSLMAKLRPVLDEIDRYKTFSEPKNEGALDENPEYQLLTQANTLSTQIDGEIAILHKFIRDHYSLRFPYLEELIKNPIDYAKTVAIIRNGPMDDIKSVSDSTDNIVGASLKSVLDGPSLMVVTVEATRADGRNLSDAEMALILEACSTVLDLDKAKGILTEYVQSRMNVFAPNLTVLIGSLTAAQLINFAGGLSGLAKTPACNLAPLGSNKASGTGFATNTGDVRHRGFVYHSPLLQQIRPDLRKQALRIVSSKIILAARVDSVHESPDGSTGQKFKEECERRLDKLTEPPPNQGVRALPVPDDKPSRKRGGRRARKAKEATAMTELRKAQNRMVFGKEEKEVSYGDSVKGLGMIGAQDTGRVRAQQIDQRTRAKLSKKNPGWGGATAGAGTAIPTAGNATVLRAQGLRAGGIGGSVGTSSIAFTPVQGLELVDPKVRDEMNRKRKAEDDKWFKGGTFTQLAPPKIDAAGFKVPELPQKKAKTDGSA